MVQEKTESISLLEINTEVQGAINIFNAQTFLRMPQSEIEEILKPGYKTLTQKIEIIVSIIIH